MLRIKELCLEKNISIAKLASLMNISSSALSQSISGNPSLERLEQIAIHLGVNVSELFDYQVNPNNSSEFKCPACGTTLELIKK